MPYVKRSETGEIVAISQRQAEGFDDQVPADSAELTDFLQGLAEANSSLSATELKPALTASSSPIDRRPLLGIPTLTCPATLAGVYGKRH